MTEDQIKQMSKEALFEKLTQLNDQLKSFGWPTGIYSLLYGVKTHGFLYEAKTYPGTTDCVKPTPMNCFAVIAHSNPDFIITLIHHHEFEALLKLVSHIGMCMEVALKKFPQDFLVPPIQLK